MLDFKNNYTNGELHDINEQLAEREEVQYICYGKEEGESGSPYLQLKDRKRPNQVVKFSGNKRFHWEGQCSKSNRSARDYCFKQQGEEFKNPQGQWEAGLKKGSSFLLQQTLEELGVKVVKKGEQD